jgi:hypothetical protein
MPIPFLHVIFFEPKLWNKKVTVVSVLLKGTKRITLNTALTGLRLI